MQTILTVICAEYKIHRHNHWKQWKMNEFKYKSKYFVRSSRENDTEEKFARLLGNDDKQLEADSLWMELF